MSGSGSGQSANEGKEPDLLFDFRFANELPGFCKMSHWIFFIRGLGWNSLSAAYYSETNDALYSRMTFIFLFLSYLQYLILGNPDTPSSICYAIWRW